MLAADERFTVPGFGAFETRESAEATRLSFGRIVTTAAHRKARFKVGDNLARMVREGDTTGTTRLFGRRGSKKS
jgi:nucleoid DNA-binding protein